MKDGTLSAAMVRRSTRSQSDDVLLADKLFKCSGTHSVGQGSLFLGSPAALMFEQRLR